MNLRCLLGRHKWALQSNDDGETFRECRRCRAVENHLPFDFGFDTPGPGGG